MAKFLIISLLMTLVLTILITITKPVTAEGIPAGSYKDSCRNYRTEGNVLYAECKARNGRWYSSSLEYKSCISEIWNGDGKLLCNKAPLPTGSYKNSCRDLWSDGITLKGSCKMRDGSWKGSSITNYSNCNSEIYNMGGYLTCVKGASKAPSGSYLKSCIDISVEGTKLVAKCRTKNGAWITHHFYDFDKCSAGIMNDDGHMRCETATSPKSATGGLNGTVLFNSYGEKPFVATANFSGSLISATGTSGKKIFSIPVKNKLTPGGVVSLSFFVDGLMKGTWDVKVSYVNSSLSCKANVPGFVKFNLTVDNGTCY